MKKILVIFASLLFAVSVFADKKAGMEVSVYGSYDFASTNSTYHTMGFGETAENDGGSGMSFGAGLNIFLNPSNALVFGVGYQSFKPVMKISDSFAWIKYEVDAAYINFQIGYRYYNSGFFGGIGFDLGLVSKYQIHETSSLGTNKTYDVGDQTSNLGGSKSSNVDLYLEIGYSFQINEQVSLDILGKYRAGLTNIYTNSNASKPGVGGFDEVKLRAIVLQAAVNFAF